MLLQPRRRMPRHRQPEMRSERQETSARDADLADLLGGSRRARQHPLRRCRSRRPLTPTRFAACWQRRCRRRFEHQFRPAAMSSRIFPSDNSLRGKYQPRADMRQEALEELAISIRNQGVIQPIVVRPLPGSSHGEHAALRNHRWRTSLESRADRRPHHHSRRHPPRAR